MHPWQAIFGGEVHDAPAVVQEEPIRQDKERARSFPENCRERVVELLRGSHPQGEHFHSQNLGGGLRRLFRDHLQRTGGIPEHGNVRHVGYHFPEQL
jgi:hypothetical protein